ncbi:MAG TPA: PIN domain-containing protein [bacterium]|nr:PIN domain-containing protein [bacterium]HRQ70176.1 PIN domain-containing protein [bacterium]
MKALLDTNIIIHREANTVVNKDIGSLFKWLDKGKYEKCVHPITIEEIKKNPNPKTVETILAKIDSYILLKTVAPILPEVAEISDHYDKGKNDVNDSALLNEVLSDRVDILITEDKRMHFKARLLNVSDKVFNIDSFLEKVVSEHPELIDYRVLQVRKKHFGEIDVKDSFFDSFREDYPGFEKWFNRKADEIAYITEKDDKILSFLYLKTEDRDENYSDVSPVFLPKKRLKIGTFKVVSNGLRLGERFLKIIFDNAIINRVDEIYVTIFEKRMDQARLINLLEDWGFMKYGKKGEELVYVRDFTPNYDTENPKLTFPYFSKNANVFLNPIYPEYHTNLLPDSILKTESPENFIESQPHRNAISKVYISRSWERNLKCGDIIIFYRTGGYHKSVISTIGIVDDVIFDIEDEADFIRKCRKRSVFKDLELSEYWNYSESNRPFIVNFLYTYSFPRRINLAKMIELGIIKDIESAPRGFQKITKQQFETILKETGTDESIIVD